MLRVIFAATVVYLLRIVGIKFAGGILLLYVVWKFFRELRRDGEADAGAHAAGKRPVRTLKSAIGLILLADVSMSLDNVLAVSGASQENIVVLGIGLAVSIILMAIASNLIASKLEKYPQVQWAGLLVVFFVIIEVVATVRHSRRNTR